MKIEITERELRQMYDEFLDECYGQVKIGPYEYPTSRALKNADDVAYWDSFYNWLDSMDGESFTVKDGRAYELHEDDEVKS